MIKIKNKCANCGSSLSFFKSFFASKSFPMECVNCGSKQFRKHEVSKLLSYIGGSIGLFVLLFLFMAKGMEVVTSFALGYLLSLATIYVAEISMIDLSTYTNQDHDQAMKQSKRNVWAVFAIILLGAVLYIFDI